MYHCIYAFQILSAFPYHHTHSLEAGQIHGCRPKGSDRVREQKNSVFSAVLHSQVGAARSATVSLRRAHKHKAAWRGRDGWLEKQEEAWRTDAAHTISLAWRKGSKKWMHSLSLLNFRPSLTDTLFFQGLPILTVLYFYCRSSNDCEEHTTATTKKQSKQYPEERAAISSSRIFFFRISQLLHPPTLISCSPPRLKLC